MSALPTCRVIRDGTEMVINESDLLDSDERVEEESQRTLDDYTVDELKAYAEENEIDLGGATKKADIRAAIDAVEE